MKILVYKKTLTLFAILIVITTFIAYYIMSNKSTVIPKSATLVQNIDIGKDIYE